MNKKNNKIMYAIKVTSKPVTHDVMHCSVLKIYQLSDKLTASNFICSQSPWWYIAHLWQECHNSKFGIFELLV
jgi:hypothetical protein